jgi:tmRNA-binding protein
MLKNARWELFCNATLTEPTLGDAFIKAFPHAKAWKRKTVQERASVLAKRDKIQTRINELKQELVKRTLWTRESSVKVLARIALKGERDSDKISSIKELNAMHGFNAPIAVDMSNKDGSLRAPTLDASKLSTSTLKELMGVIDIDASTLD